eukprot:TRINITY_DN1_c0_g1_i1.p1 TRINITY_DN1_c0_g1~~TRINITY_DN1_c0_g1_i1.p1  ORF type:complete len:883 (-),score=117.55 TRINITY_DN1_c0_g1_i1:68-2716(-)
MQRYVYLFKEGSALMRAKLGLKGSRLSEMYRMGLPVPPGLAITTDACAKYFEKNRTHPPLLHDQLREKLDIIEKSLGQRFGFEKDPLLLSVRPSAEVQMPGTNKDLCNIGLNDKSVVGLARASGNEKFAWDTYRRFIEEFAVRAMSVHPNKFVTARGKFLKSKGIQKATELSVEEIRQLVQEYLKVVHRYTGRRFPQDSEEQLWMTIDSFYNWWRSEQAMTYRRINDLTHLEGTGLTIQKMVFGNLNQNSGAGRVFSRNPITGEKGMYGEYVMNDTLESLIYGVATPRNISDLKIALPNIYSQLDEYYQKLEQHFQDVQDIQFTIENGNFYLLHSKNARLGAQAEVKTAVDFVNEKINTQTYAIKNIYAPLLGQLHHKIIDPKEMHKHKLLGKGLSGSNASASGHVLFNKNKVEAWKKEGKNIILITKDATADNYVVLKWVNGYITQTGGTTSDAAILVREKSIASVLSCADLEVDESLTKCRLGSNIIKEGDLVTVNGMDGEIYAGEVPLVDNELIPEYETLVKWADSLKKMQVLVNADTPEDVSLGLKYGAEGIGLCKSEHMFNDPEKLKLIRQAILSESVDERKRVLEDLVQLLKEDFKTLFRIMSGKPSIIRILDPPLNTFVPGDAKSQAELSADLEIPVEVIARQHAKLAQYNPTLGLRGSRLAFVYPELVQFEVKSVFMAALDAIEEGITPFPYIELPMISSAKEFTLVKKIIDEIAEETGASDKIKYKVGTLIEIPRAALAADELAKEADFMYFGTNDLTQLTCGFSEEDSELLIEKYVDNGVYAKNPFISLDMTGVGNLMQITIDKTKKVKKNIKFGISGAHASDPASIALCQKLGLDEISCPAQKISIAKVAAAQAVLPSEEQLSINHFDKMI